MLPTIVTAKDTDSVYQYGKECDWWKNLRGEFDASEEGVGVEELRRWLVSFRWSDERQTSVYWLKSADSLSMDCQNTLLKVLEEVADNILFILSVTNLSALLPTVRSRCKVIRIETDSSGKEVELSDERWKELVEIWKGGADKTTKWVDGNEKELVDREVLLVMRKIHKLLRESPNLKRVEMLVRVLDCWGQLNETNTNKRLILDRWLIESGEIVRA